MTNSCRLFRGEEGKVVEFTAPVRVPRGQSGLTLNRHFARESFDWSVVVVFICLDHIIPQGFDATPLYLFMAAQFSFAVLWHNSAAI